MKVPHIDVCICTYRRPAMLRRLLEAVARQQTENAFTFGLIVADNDAERSAETVVSTFAEGSPVPTVYRSQPIKNIALTRNAAVGAGSGDFIAFVDDDEFPVEQWLQLLWKTCEKMKVAGVLGPVRPHFDEPPPTWVVKGKFCERPEHPTGTVMDPGKCRTGNVLFRRSLIAATPEPFRAEFGTGGEDVDFFLRMGSAGHTFVWCNEAPVYETVPASRLTSNYMYHRALLRGQNNMKLEHQKLNLLLRSVAAVPAYAIVLPFTFAAGRHTTVKYTIKLLDHLGRLLSSLKINVVNDRPA